MARRSGRYGATGTGLFILAATLTAALLCAGCSGSDSSCEGPQCQSDGDAESAPETDAEEFTSDVAEEEAVAEFGDEGESEPEPEAEIEPEWAPWTCDEPYFANHPWMTGRKEDLERLHQAALTDPTFQIMLARAQGVGSWGDPGRSVADESLYDPYQAHSQGALAKNAAWLHWLGVPAPDGAEPYGDKATRMLAAFSTDIHDIDFLDELLDAVTIHGSEAIVYLVQAFDLMAGSCAYTQTEYEAIRARLWTLGEEFYSAYWLVNPFALALWRNNHAIKSASALGMLALLQPDHPRAELFRDSALSIIDEYHYNWQIAPGGAFAEGPAYFEYTMINLRGYGLAFNRANGGQSVDITRRCAASKDNDCAESPLSVPDILTSDAHKSVVFDWLPGLTLPGGYLANIDDADFTAYNWGFDAWFYEDGRFLQLWRDSTFAYGVTSDDAVETMALYKADLEAVEMPLESGLRGGYARLARGSTFNDFFALLIGERDDARSHGMGHEQPDNQSFILARGGLQWLIDSGYIHFSHRSAVAKDINHNVILVDGLGGPTDDIMMGGTDDDADLVVPGDLPAPYGSATLTRNLVELSRTLVLPDDNLVMVIDRFSPGDLNPHRYNLLFHTNGGGSCQGATTTLPDGGTVVQEGTRLRIRTTATVPLGATSSDVMTHSFIRLPVTETQQTHVRLNQPVAPDATVGPALACTALSFTAAEGPADPNDELAVEPIAVVEDGPLSPPACLAASLGPTSVRYYLWRPGAIDGEGCYRLSQGAETLGVLCADARLTRVETSGATITAEAIGPGTARFTTP